MPFIEAAHRTSARSGSRLRSAILVTAATPASPSETERAAGLTPSS
jgi:hypothetical protein